MHCVRPVEKEISSRQETLKPLCNSIVGGTRQGYWEDWPRLRVASKTSIEREYRWIIDEINIYYQTEMDLFSLFYGVHRSIYWQCILEAVAA